MNAVERQRAREKRFKHHLKQLAKPKVKALCQTRGIDFARMELTRDNKLLVWDTAGKAHMIVV